MGCAHAARGAHSLDRLSVAGGAAGLAAVAITRPTGSDATAEAVARWVRPGLPVVACRPVRSPTPTAAGDRDDRRLARRRAIRRMMREQFERDPGEFTRDLGTVMAAITDLTKAFEGSYAPNWVPDIDLDDDSVDLSGQIPHLHAGDRDRLVRLGIPVVWVPRFEVLEALVAASDADVPGCLEAHHAEILDDCAVALSEITDSTWELHGTVAIFRDAVDACQRGSHNPAQALASNVWDTTVVWGYGRGHRGAAERFRAGHNQQEVRTAFTLIAGIPALATYRPADGDPIPTTWNRHASVHSVVPDQYTLANALVAIMMATSLLRELYQQDRVDSRI